MKQVTKTKRDAERIRIQENKDFENTKDIINELFKRWETSFTQMPEFSASDMRFKVQKDDISYKYNVEIKTRTQDMEKYPQLALKVKKYCRLKEDTLDDEKLLYFVLVNHNEYFVFDLKKLDLNKCDIRNWKIKAQEYNVSGSHYVEEPTIFIPITQVKMHGYYKEKEA